MSDAKADAIEPVPRELHSVRIANDKTNQSIYYREQEAYVTVAGLYDRRPTRVVRYRNIIRSVVDTAGSITTRQTPVAEVDTYGGDSMQAKTAKEITRFGQGVFAANSWPRLAKSSWLDARLSAFGGVLWEVFHAVKDRPRRVVGTRLDPNCVWPNNNRPDKITIRRWLTPIEIEERGWGKKLKITDRDYGRIKDEDYGPTRVRDSRVVMIEQTWDLSADPAQMLVSLNGDAKRSFQEKYDATRFPMAFCVWSEIPGSFYGVSVADLGRKYDAQINHQAHIALDVAGRWMAPKLLTETNSEPTDQPWNSAAFEKIHYRGRPPTWFPGATLPAQFFDIYDRCKAEYHEEVGVSGSSVEATRPAGINSLPGQREFQETITGRLAPALERWEEFTRDSFEAMLSECFRVLGKSKAKVAAPGRRAIESIDWAGAQASWDDIVVRVNKTSALPIHPAARREAVRELKADGVIKDQASYLRLLGLHDL